MKNLIYKSGVWSIMIQIITFIIGLYVLLIQTPISLLVVKQLLWLETIAQVIEFVFYAWMVSNFSKIKNITIYRYYDWILSTPLMLYVYMMYLAFMKNKENVNGIQKNLYDLTKENSSIIIVLLLLNALMFMFGY